ncbi:hypothetical protein SAMN02746064_00866 [Alkalibacter saccharofermentans DSM 14828]|uniref:Uncharacterized protein n=1 Tax=Alkalibacter saccharofermentans DSM 14828 TaxID=1120975 RepID=A0A1M4UZ88_9FIRM|nr:hypothetical protein SAMN02746064_00866 [Alkalibacter saccharofermentans DSM 14828]
MQSSMKHLKKFDIAIEKQVVNNRILTIKQAASRPQQTVDKVRGKPRAFLRV